MLNIKIMTNPSWNWWLGGFSVRLGVEKFGIFPEWYASPSGTW